MKLFKIKHENCHDADFVYVMSEDVQTAIEKWRDSPVKQDMPGYDAGTIMYLGEVIV